MEWVTVISFLLVGILLIIAEIVFIPGTTVVGILGFLLTAAGVALSFHYFGKPVGWMTLLASGVVSGATLIWSLRAGVWNRFSLKSAIDSKVNEGQNASLTVGQEGKATSALRPMGKAEFEGKQYEVTTLGNFVDSGSSVRIISISSGHVTVEMIS